MSDKTLADLPFRTEAARTEDKKKYASNLSDPDKVRLITESVREAKKFRNPGLLLKINYNLKGFEWVRAHHTGSKVSSQGFVIMKVYAFEPSRDFGTLSVFSNEKSTKIFLQYISGATIN